MKQVIVNIHEAKTNLSRLLIDVEGGQEIVIARSGKPIARLVPLQAPTTPRIPGRDVGQGWIAEDFDGPLPDELLQAFES